MEILSNLPPFVTILLVILVAIVGIFLLRFLFQAAGFLLRVGCFLLIALVVVWLLLRVFNIW